MEPGGTPVMSFRRTCSLLATPPHSPGPWRVCTALSQESAPIKTVAPLTSDVPNACPAPAGFDPPIRARLTTEVVAEDGHGPGDHSKTIATSGGRGETAPQIRCPRPQSRAPARRRLP
jgi:hypothetical protein